MSCSPHPVECREVAVPVGVDVAGAEDPALLACQHVSADRRPVLVVDGPLLGRERHAEEVRHEVVARLVEREAVLRDLIGPSPLVVVVLWVAAVHLRADLVHLRGDGPVVCQDTVLVDGLAVDNVPNAGLRPRRVRGGGPPP